jgi:hypothetical protein
MNTTVPVDLTYLAHVNKGIFRVVYTVIVVLWQVVRLTTAVFLLTTCCYQVGS